MVEEILEFVRISCGFPFLDFRPLKAWHFLHLGTERYMTPPDGVTIRTVRPMGWTTVVAVLFTKVVVNHSQCICLYGTIYSSSTIALYITRY